MMNFKWLAMFALLIVCLEITNSAAAEKVKFLTGDDFRIWGPLLPLK
jgi:hypothetical protein